MLIKWITHAELKSNRGDKWVGIKYPNRVELRKEVGKGGYFFSQMWIVISKNKDHPTIKKWGSWARARYDKDENVIISFSMNGTSVWTQHEFDEMGEIIEEAMAVFNNKIIIENF